jgi:hypothetical protein
MAVGKASLNRFHRSSEDPFMMITRAIRLWRPAGIAAAMLALAPSAQSAPGPSKADQAATSQPARRPVAAAEPLQTSSFASAAQAAAATSEPNAECQRLRRKLWLEDEGWVVRRVSVCR